MGKTEPTILPSVPPERIPPTTTAGHPPLLADDIVVACTAGIGVMALGGAALSLAGLLYLTAHFGHYDELAYLLFIGTGVVAGFRARVGGLARRLFALCTGSSLLIPVLSHLGFGAVVGWELVLGTTAVGGAVIWARRRKGLARDAQPALLEQGNQQLPAPPGAV
jgi:hypothetical protein